MTKLFSSERNNPATSWTKPALERVNAWLFKPSRYITEPGERKQSALLAALTLFFSTLVLTGMIASATRPDKNVAAILTLATLTIASLGSYGLSRTRHYQVSGIVIIGIWTVATIMYVYSGNTNSGTLFALLLFIPFGFILGTVMLPIKILAVTVFVNLSSLFLLPVFYPDIGRPFITSAGVLVCMGGLTLIAQRHRNEVERERLRALTNKNLELQTLQANLELANQALGERIVEREALISELEAKNVELERFTYTVSHDLKSPLITISGFLGYLEEDISSGDLEHFKHDSQRIREAVDRMQLLLNELLELSRIGRLINPPEIIPFENMVQEALAIVHGQLESRGVKIMLQPDLPAVYGDRQRLVEILQNLLDNAAKFMGDQPEPRIEIGCTELDGKSIFFIKDNGIGIDPKYHEQIFGLFNKLDPKTEGTGVGLALVRRIIEFHGGKIWVESEVGEGSTFYFTLKNDKSSKD